MAAEVNRYRSVDLGDGYVAHFYWPTDSFMLVQLSYEGTFVAQTRTSYHLRAARWARRQMERHRKAMQILKGDT